MAENGVCSACSSLASHFCFCHKSTKLYFCPVCLPQHIVKGVVGHSVLPIEADMLVSSAEYIDIYNSSQEALCAFNASLDSLTQQIKTEEAAAYAIRTEVYQQQAAALYEAHAFIGQELSDKYQSVLQEIKTVKAEVNNTARRRASDFSPVTLTFIESFQHIQIQGLIDCRSELQTRVQVYYQPAPTSPYTPLQEILSKWYCQQCELCLNVKAKFLMKNQPDVQAEETQKRSDFWMCGRIGCQRENPYSQTACYCGFANPYSIGQVPLSPQFVPEQGSDAFPWACASYMFGNQQSDSRWAFCGYLKETSDSKPVLLNSEYSPSVQLHSRPLSTSQEPYQSFPCRVPKKPGDGLVAAGGQRQDTAFQCIKERFVRDVCEARILSGEAAKLPITLDAEQ